MTMDQILTFFRDAEERERNVAPDILVPAISELSADELEVLLTANVALRSAVM